MGTSITRVARLKSDRDNKAQWEKSANDEKAMRNKDQSGVEVMGTYQGTYTNKQQAKETTENCAQEVSQTESGVNRLLTRSEKQKWKDSVYVLKVRV
jgi:hypothetical protein